MSVQDMSQFVALITLDQRQLARFVKDPEVTDPEAVNDALEERRMVLRDYALDFDIDKEVPLLESGDMTTIFNYLRQNPRPVPDMDGGN